MTPQYGPDNDLVDYILGITYEIWEQGQIAFIDRYYSENCLIHALDSTTRGAAAVIEGTRATLQSFSDRLLLAENVVWSGNRAAGFYSSHRLTSPMTNTGDTLFGSATGKVVRIMNIADCVVEDGVITGEWLVRDNLALVQQLGFDPKQAAETLAAAMTPEHAAWLRSEAGAMLNDAQGLAAADASGGSGSLDFAKSWLETLWTGSATSGLSFYAPYATLYRAPNRYMAGREAILAHYAGWQQRATNARAVVDHVITQPMGHDGTDIAIRWRVGLERADSSRPVFILGVSHLRCASGKITAEWTVFDELAVEAQHHLAS
ncbi:MAG: nuclear transport factor 2 family protein [Pseudomonadota bacterium]